MRCRSKPKQHGTACTCLRNVSKGMVPNQSRLFSRTGSGVPCPPPCDSNRCRRACMLWTLCSMLASDNMGRSALLPASRHDCHLLCFCLRIESILSGTTPWWCYDQHSMGKRHFQHRSKKAKRACVQMLLVGFCMRAASAWSSFHSATHMVAQTCPAHTRDRK